MNSNFTLKDCLFGGVKLAKNADADKYGRMGKGFILFGVDMSSSVHIDNKTKDILVLGESSTIEL